MEAPTLHRIEWVIGTRSAWPRLLATVGVGGVVLATASLVQPRAVPVLVPVVTLTVVLHAFFESLRGDPAAPSGVFEIGFLYAAAAWVYGSYPLVGFVVNGFEYGPLNDIRLYLASPKAADVGRIGWMYVVHLVAFVAAYSAVRAPRTPTRPALIGRLEGLLLLLLVLGTKAFFLVLGRIFEWSFTTNLDRYVALARLPQLLAQVAGHLDGIRFTAEVGLLVFLFQRYRRYRLLIAVWLVATGIETVVQKQSRTELVLLFLAALILFDGLVRRIRLSRLVGLALASLLAFNLLGARRAGFVGLSEARGIRQLFVANEFETLLANDIDLKERVDSRTLEPLPQGFWANDLMAVVPQQLLSWQKTTPADWYIRTMYPNAAEAGVGFCFGTVAESIVGGGWVDLILRGSLLGLVVGFVQRAVERRKAGSFWWYTFGIWLSVLLYHSVRNTTFSYLAMAWYRFLPVVLTVGAAAWLIRTALGRRSARS